MIGTPRVHDAAPRSRIADGEWYLAPRVTLTRDMRVDVDMALSVWSHGLSSGPQSWHRGRVALHSDTREESLGMASFDGSAQASQLGSIIGSSILSGKSCRVTWPKPHNFLRRLGFFRLGRPKATTRFVEWALPFPAGGTLPTAAMLHDGRLPASSERERLPIAHQHVLFCFTL